MTIYLEGTLKTVTSQIKTIWNKNPLPFYSKDFHAETNYCGNRIDVQRTCKTFKNQTPLLNYVMNKQKTTTKLHDNRWLTAMPSAKHDLRDSLSHCDFMSTATSIHNVLETVI